MHSKTLIFTPLLSDTLLGSISPHPRSPLIELLKYNWLRGLEKKNHCSWQLRLSVMTWIPTEWMLFAKALA